MFRNIDVNNERFSDCRTLSAALEKQHPPSGRLELSNPYDDKGWCKGLQKMEMAFQKSTHIKALNFESFRFTTALEATFTNLLMGLENLEELSFTDCKFDKPPPNFSSAILQLNNLRRFKIGEPTARGLAMDLDILRPISKIQVPKVCAPAFYLSQIHWNHIFRNIGLVELELSYDRYALWESTFCTLSLQVLKALMSSKTIKKFSGDVSFGGSDIAKVFGQVGNPIEWNFGEISINLEKDRPHEILALRNGFSAARFTDLTASHPLFKNLLAVVERSANSTSFVFDRSTWISPSNALLFTLAKLSNPRLTYDYE